MKVIEDDIKSLLKSNGIENVIIKMVYAPAWTTDWISDAAKEVQKRLKLSPTNREATPPVGETKGRNATSTSYHPIMSGRKL